MSTLTAGAVERGANRAKYGSMSRDRRWALRWSYFFLVMFAIFFLMPPIYMLITSLKTSAEISAATNPWWVFNPTLSNYIELLTSSQYQLFFRNSAMVSIFVVTLTMIISIPAAFALARMKFWGSATLATGVFLTAWGSYGTGDGQFIVPTGVATDGSGNVYVVDAGSYRIQKFTNTGTFLTAWGSAGRGNGQFNYPTGVAVDGSGNVFVADAANNRIQKFDSNGTFVTAWTGATSGDATNALYGPSGVGTDGSGSVYVADTGNNRIEKSACR